MSPVPMPLADAGSDRFRTTHWSLIVAAQDRESTEAKAALADLCQAYWYPLYAFIRRQGHSMDDARDLTQEFFARGIVKSCGCPAALGGGLFHPINKPYPGDDLWEQR